MSETSLHDADPEELSRALRATSMPDSIETPLGTFELVDGVPTTESTVKLYDALDFVRGVEVFLNAVPGASLVAMRNGFRSIGLTEPNQIGITEPRANSGSLFLTPNTETTYGTMFFDLKATGPLVIEPPKNSLCVVDDFWFRYVADMGIAGPDKGEGGKYLFLPPGYDGDEPDGYFVYRTPTFTNWVVFRALGGRAGHEGDPRLPAGRRRRTHRRWSSPTSPTFQFNTVHANDFSFFEEVDQIIQEEPTTALDPERAGQLAGLGIVHGKPFEPDEARRATLDQAAKAGAAISRALVYAPRDPGAYCYDGSGWLQAFIGGSYEFLHAGARLLDARTQFHYFATVITPAMAHAQVGAGSAYAYTAHDANGDALDGARTYSLTLPPNPPAKNFWSIDVYDTQTRSLLQTDNPYPSVMSLGDTVVPDDDGGFTIWFGPDSPGGARGQLDPDHPRQELVPDAAPLRPARSLVRQDLAARRSHPDLTYRPGASDAPGGIATAARDHSRRYPGHL